jgi:hypothetical protein
MTFGKGRQRDVRRLGRKGAFVAQHRHGSFFKKKWTDEKWRRKKRKSSVKTMTAFNNSLTREELIAHRRNAGKRSRLRENSVVKRIDGEYDRMFLPYVVCDRIAIKKGRLIFVEIKKSRREKLKPGQQEFKDICEKMGIEYRIHYYE